MCLTSTATPSKFGGVAEVVKHYQGGNMNKLIAKLIQRIDKNMYNKEVKQINNNWKWLADALNV
jgi:hypothetical protein